MNPRVTALAPSLIRALHDRKRPDAIDLGLGQPTLLPELAPLREAVEWVAQHGCPYSPNAGFADLRAAVAEYFRYPGLDLPENVLITVGSQEALLVAIKALLNPTGPLPDEALVVGPAFPAYSKMCELEGVVCREVSMDPAADFAPSAARVLDAITTRTRLLIIASPNNPTGRTWPESELIQLAEGLSRAPHPIYVLWDEVYRELYFTPTPPASLARFYPRTLVAGSLSKSCALTGLRLGWLLAPSEVYQATYKAHQLTVSCVDTLAQRAALSIFAQPSRLTAHRAHYQAQHRALLLILDRLGLSFVRPEGAFYCLIRLQGAAAADSHAFCLRMLDEQNVVLIPGAAFGAEGFVRITFVPPMDQIEQGLHRLAQELRRQP